jgi:hypothetical protein
MNNFGAQEARRESSGPATAEWWLKELGTAHLAALNVITIARQHEASN